MLLLYIMHRENGQIEYIRQALLENEIGLRGPTSGYADEMTIVEAAATEHVNNEWETAQKLFRGLGQILGHEELSKSSEELPEYFTDSFYKLTGHFVVAVGRYNEHSECLRSVTGEAKDAIPLLFDDFRTVSALLKFTESDYKKANRHPSLVLNPTDTQKLIDESSAAGFTPSYIKVFASKAHPFNKLNEAKESTEKLRSDPDLVTKESLLKKMAATRRDPRLAVRQLEQTISILNDAFGDHPSVSAADLEHFAQNYSPEKAESEVALFIERVDHYSTLYDGHPVIDRTMVRAVCRRSKDPQSLIDRIIFRYEEIGTNFPNLAETRLAVYIARNFSNPGEVINDALKKIKVDPKLGANKNRTEYHALWTLILGKEPAEETMSEFDDEKL